MVTWEVFIERNVNALGFVVDWLLNLLNSGFGIALAGSFAGAVGAGFLLIQRDIRREKKENLSDFIVAITSTMNCAIYLLSLKSQNIIPALNEIERNNKLLEGFPEDALTNPSAKAFLPKGQKPVMQSGPSLSRFAYTEHDLSALTKVCLRHASADPLLALYSKALMDVMSNLRATMYARGEIVATIKKDLLKDSKRLFFYYGFADNSGNRSAELETSTRAVALSLDDALYLTIKLNDRLVKVARTVIPKNQLDRLITYNVAEKAKYLIPEEGHIPGLPE